MTTDIRMLETYGYSIEHLEEVSKKIGVSMENLIASEADRMRANLMRVANLITLERWLEIQMEIAVIQEPGGTAN
jgi:hypothetical protein